MNRKLVLFLLGVLIIQKCLACSTDLECGNADAPGVCVGGICQCGVGFVGNVGVDPTTCSLSCVPPVVPDSVAFLKEPTLALSAAAGNLQLSVVQDSYLKQNPTTVAFLNPSNGSRCSLLSNMLGQAVWTQGVVSAGCDQSYAFSSPFAQQVAQPCWEELPASTETGAQYAINFRNFKTQVEVVQVGEAPFGQTSSSRASTTIRRELRRNFTLSVATQFRPNSAPFAVESTGNIQYRLVVIDNQLLSKKIVVQIETRVADTAKLLSAAVAESSTGVSARVSPVAITSACDPASPAGFCSQFTTVELSDDPCSVNAANLVLTVQFACANGSDPSTCGYTNLPAGNLFTLPNNILTYDACPVTVAYGLDTTNSWLRLHTDVARSNVVSAPGLLESTLYGRVRLQGEGDAVFTSATVSELHIWRVASGNNVDLGDQKSAAFLTLALDTSTASNPTIDFDLTLDPAFFDIANQYYVEAYVDLVFANTGPLTRKLRMKMEIPQRMKPKSNSLKKSWASNSRSADLNNQVVYLSRSREAEEQQSQNKGVFSSVFKLEQRDQDQTEEGDANLGLIIGASVGGACALAAIVVVVIVVAKKRRRKDEDEESSSTDMSI